MHTQPRSVGFRWTALTILAVTFSINGNAQESNTAFDPLDKPNVIEAIRSIWAESAHGRHRIEAAFRLDHTTFGWRVVPIPPTNQARKVTMGIIPGATFAIFHVHTVAGEPHPSPADRAIADRYGLAVYTLHYAGLFEYDPGTKTITQLRKGIKWLQDKPAAETSQAANGSFR